MAKKFRSERAAASTLKNVLDTFAFTSGNGLKTVVPSQDVRVANLVSAETANFTSYTDFHKEGKVMPPRSPAPFRNNFAVPTSPVVIVGDPVSMLPKRKKETHDAGLKKAASTQLRGGGTVAPADQNAPPPPARSDKNKRHFVPMAAVSGRQPPADQRVLSLQEQIIAREMGISPAYGGSICNPKNWSKDVPDSLNTVIWITGLPAKTETAALLNAMLGVGRLGKIWACVINRPLPYRGHVDAAAKIQFFTHDGAEKLVLRNMFLCNGAACRVSWNRIKNTDESDFDFNVRYLEPIIIARFRERCERKRLAALEAQRVDPHGKVAVVKKVIPFVPGRHPYDDLPRPATSDRVSRVVVMIGSPRKCSREYLDQAFKNGFYFDVERIKTHWTAEYYGKKLSCVEWRFGCYRSQAESAMKMMRTDFADKMRAWWGIDPLDTGVDPWCQGHEMVDEVSKAMGANSPPVGGQKQEKERDFVVLHASIPKNISPSIITFCARHGRKLPCGACELKPHQIQASQIENLMSSTTTMTVEEGPRGQNQIARGGAAGPTSHVRMPIHQHQHPSPNFQRHYAAPPPLPRQATTMGSSHPNVPASYQKQSSHSTDNYAASHQAWGPPAHHSSRPNAANRIWANAPEPTAATASNNSVWRTNMPLGPSAQHYYRNQPNRIQSFGGDAHQRSQVAPASLAHPGKTSTTTTTTAPTMPDSSTWHENPPSDPLLPSNQKKLERSAFLAHLAANHRPSMSKAEDVVSASRMEDVSPFPPPLRRRQVAASHLSFSEQQGSSTGVVTAASTMMTMMSQKTAPNAFASASSGGGGGGPGGKMNNDNDDDEDDDSSLLPGAGWGISAGYAAARQQIKNRNMMLLHQNHAAAAAAAAGPPTSFASPRCDGKDIVVQPLRNGPGGGDPASRSGSASGFGFGLPSAPSGTRPFGVWD